MSIHDMPDGMKAEFLAAFRAEFGFGEMTATSNDDAAAMLKAAAWAWKASREAAQASEISPEVAALMQRIDDEERGQALMAEAFVRESGRASISALQRHFKIAYGAACRLMDRLVADGVVSAIDSEGRRQVLPKVEP